MAGTDADRKRSPRPLDGEGLRALAFAYVGRYATSTGRLRDYLRRKLGQRGWAEEGEPPVDELVERCAAAGWVDDAAFARARSGALARAGYGARRRDLALRAAGLDPAQRTEAERALAEEEGDPAWRSALAYARRRRLGPFARVPMDQAGERRAIAALVRAGHAYDLARRLVALAPDELPDRNAPAG